MLAPLNDTALGLPGRKILADKPADLGDAVKKGDVLLRFASGGLPAQIEEARAEMEYARSNVERAKELDRVLTRAERDERDTQFAVKSARLRQLELELSDHIIVAPHDGIVVDASLSVGEVSGDDPAMRLVFLETLRVEMDFPLTAFGQYRVGDTLSIAVDGVTQRDATITFVDPLIDLASRTFRVQAHLPNEDGKFTAGMECRM
ncbi:MULTISPECIES: efflux RND transporter periplasmic adaptor subunit [unclassified Aliiroseovarius]|uniref:efflux RND transporter periplasmic adaptor subunit n=1 Tax=unclassified Aliiroseovarius TaxID=2623558 RepID=UPI0015699A79|nr:MULTISPECIES: efflux RND transporter periplasmic adaptor subunit [unclassified Aliiroseovarius]